MIKSKLTSALTAASAAVAVTLLVAVPAVAGTSATKTLNPPTNGTTASTLYTPDSACRTAVDSSEVTDTASTARAPINGLYGACAAVKVRVYSGGQGWDNWTSWAIGTSHASKYSSGLNYSKHYAAS